MPKQSSPTPNTEDIQSKNVMAKITFDLPFCLCLKDDRYEAQMPTYKAFVQTYLKKHKHIDERLFIDETTWEIRNDRYGRIRYTSIEVIIPAQAIIEKDTKKRIKNGELEIPKNGLIRLHIKLEDLGDRYLQPALEEAIDVVNYFIAIYREVTNSFFVKTISRDDIYKAIINWYEDEELLCGDLNVQYGKHGLTLEAKLKPDIEQKFRDRLKENLQPSIIAELAMNARDYLELDNYRMAVIESRTCIEVLIDRLLLGYFECNNINIEDAKDVLKVRADVVCDSMEDVVQVARINDKLKSGLKEAIGRSLAENNDIWERWLKVKTLREGAVHKGSIVSETDAIEAVNVLMDIIDFIKSGTVSI